MKRLAIATFAAVAALTLGGCDYEAEEGTGLTEERYGEEEEGLAGDGQLREDEDDLAAGQRDFGES